jgi:3-deoxy-D-manno-octulosonate 8-phosphate phosphatase KdsC-like HAD superfamily phosphatase
MEKYCVSLDEIAYVGDDYYDLSLINLLKWTYCPSDAAKIIQQNVSKVLPCSGGKGVVESLFNEVEDRINKVYPYEK